MKKFSKGAFIFFVIAAVSLFAIRSINQLRYSKDSKNNSMDITDMAAYPKEYDGITITKINHDSINGFHLLPHNKTAKGIIIALGGSEGGCNFFQAAELAKHGYETVCLFYFGQPNQPKSLGRIPLEFFGEFLAYAPSIGIDTSTLTVLGGSKGAELALVLTNYYDEIDNLVLYAPSSHVFQGLDFKNAGSSWTYNGTELPYISFYNADISDTVGMFSAMLFNYPIAYRGQYETAVKNTKNSGDMKIDISGFNGNIIMFAGENDRVWHSDVMAQEILSMKPASTEVYTYENTGHSFNSGEYGYGLMNGGTKENNQRANADSFNKALDFLSRYHK